MRTLTVVVTLLWAIPVHANAQETKPITIDYRVTTQDCPRVSTAGLATAVGVTSFGVLASMPMMALSDYANSPGMLAGGIALATASAAGLITSAIYLKRKRDTRKQYRNGACPAPLTVVPGIRF